VVKDDDLGDALLNQIVHNRIGTKGPGNAPLANGGHGVNIDGAALTIVGGGQANERNLISGNTLDGVRISGGAAANSNQVIGNYIGTDINGMADIGNRDGVVVDGAGGNTIGGDRTLGEGNVISGNRGIGVHIRDTANILVRGNYIGLDQAGMGRVSNSSHGVFIENSLNNVIGGPGAGERNVISGNGVLPGGFAQGVKITGTGSRFNRVEGNYIGTRADGTKAPVGQTTVRNQGFGVQVDGNTSNNTIGGPTAAHGNLVSGNRRAGIDMAGATNIKKNNRNGKDINGTALPNEEGGALVGGSNSLIEDNDIWYNSGPGIAVVAGTGHRISRNSIAFNTGLGIDLGDDGVTPNDFLDADTGPNNLQNYPVLTSATVANYQTTINGSLPSTPNTTFTLEFFGNNAASASQAQGERFLGSDSVTTDSNGNATFSFTFEAAFGNYVTATATDPDGNTSEFSAATAVTGSSSLAAVGSVVWADLNQNGLQDSGEAGVEGALVELYDSLGTFIDSVSTGPDGAYLFTDLSPGDYYIVVTDPLALHGFTAPYQGDETLDSNIGPVTGESEVFPLTAGEYNPTIDAGLIPNGPISGVAWVDVNDDGIRDVSESLLAGVTVSLYDEYSTFIDSTTTDGNGAYSFTDLASGTYYVTFDYTASSVSAHFAPADQGSDDSIDSDVTSGYSMDNYVSGQTSNFVLAPGGSAANVDAGIWIDPMNGEITGVAWDDANDDGIRQGGESLLSDANVSLYDQFDTFMDSTTTDGSGAYTFTSLSGGTYYVAFDYTASSVSAHFAPADQGSDDSIDSDVTSGYSMDNYVSGQTSNFVLAPGGSASNVDAGIWIDPMSGQISGTVWDDSNQDGIQDTGETGRFSGISVTLYDEFGTFLASTTTDSNGYYHFTGLGGGRYQVYLDYTGYTLSAADQTSDDLDSDFDDFGMSLADTGLVDLVFGGGLDFDAGLKLAL
jgi:parallel beta-helix repeat protein